MLIGHQKQWNFLKKVTEANKISHSYLFTGQEKLGKKKVALEWALLLTELPKEAKWKKRFISSSFNENIQEKHYPRERQRSAEEEAKSLRYDLLLVEPDTQAKRSGEDERSSSPEKEIKISQIRELIRKLSFMRASASREDEALTSSPKLYSAPIKIAIIDGAHLMNHEAQSAFLKTLEEPKGKTLLILITEFPEALFPTILSRVQVVKFYPVKEQEIKKYLKEQKIEEKEAREVTEFSFGKPGLAIDFILNPEKLKNERKVIKELTTILKANLSFRFQYVKKIAEQTNTREVLNIWLRYFRKTDIHKFKDIIKQIQEINFLLLKTNINSKLALEMLMLKL